MVQINLWIYYWVTPVATEKTSQSFSLYMFQITDLSLPLSQQLISSLQQADLYSSADPGPAGQTIYTTRHKHLNTDESDLLLQPASYLAYN